MQLYASALFAIVLAASKLQLSSSHGQQMNMHFCMDNKTISLQILAGIGDDSSCQCQTGASRSPNHREDYTRKAGVASSYKFHNIAKTWNEARKVCQEEGGHLAVINSKAEEAVLKEMLRSNSQSIRDAVNKDQALLGIHDLFQEGEWITIFGESIYSAGYDEWSKSWYGGQPDNYNSQNCGALIVNGGLDDVFCHDRLAYFCELPSICA